MVLDLAELTQNARTPIVRNRDRCEGGDDFSPSRAASILNKTAAVPRHVRLASLDSDAVISASISAHKTLDASMPVNELSATTTPRFY